MVVRAVEVHRVIANTGVDPTPEDRVTNSIGQSFGIGPGSAVYHEDVPASCERITAGDSRIRPPPHDKNPILEPAPRRVHDQRPRELAVYTATVLQSHSGRCRPVVVGTPCPCLEANLACFSRRDLNCVVRIAGSRVEPVDDKSCVRNTVAYGQMDLCTFRHPDEWSRDFKGAARLCESLNLQPGTIPPFWVPDSCPHFQSYREHPVVQAPRRQPIVVGSDFRKALLCDIPERVGLGYRGDAA